MLVKNVHGAQVQASLKHAATAMLPFRFVSPIVTPAPIPSLCAGSDAPPPQGRVRPVVTGITT